MGTMSYDILMIMVMIIIEILQEITYTHLSFVNGIHEYISNKNKFFKVLFISAINY